MRGRRRPIAAIDAPTGRVRRRAGAADAIRLVPLALDAAGRAVTEATAALALPRGMFVTEPAPPCFECWGTPLSPKAKVVMPAGGPPAGQRSGGPVGVGWWTIAIASANEIHAAVSASWWIQNHK